MANADTANVSREIRTYLSISQPIDPAQVFTLTDMDMSYALASTLVDWDDSKQVLSGLASRWETQNAKSIRFILSDKAFWSNGEPITSEQVKQSLDRAQRVHGKDLQSLFDSIEKIVCPDSKTVEIHLLGEKSVSAILKKLTEPMYGVVRIKDHDHIDLSVTSGPYVLGTTNKEETTLRQNTFWFNKSERMAERILLRSPKSGQDPQTVLLSDSWPNLIASHSLMNEATSSALKNHQFTLWKRSLDRTLMLTLFNSRLKNSEGFAFFRYLKKSLDRSTVSNGLTGFTNTDQLFPRGSGLYSERLNCPDLSTDIPASLRGRKLRVLLSPDRVSPALRDNFGRAIEKAVGVAPEFHEVPLNELSTATKKGDYDFYLGSFGVADPNFEGALSYFFELNPAPIASGQGVQDFSARTAAIRTEKDDSKRLMDARTMLNDVVCYGHIVPLFNFSTIVIAREEIDLSKVPTTDESVSFSKVRFR